MKPINSLVFPFCLVLLGIGLAGCASKRIAEPLGNGYEHVAHPTRASARDPETTRISLEYRTPGAKPVLVWPSLYGVNEVIQGDWVIFVGDRAYVHPGSDDPKGTQPRLFAVREPGLPLDITDELLWRWSKKSGKDFVRATQLLSLASPSENNGRWEIRLVFAPNELNEKDWPDTVVQMDWNEMSNIIREVKEKGAVRKDLRWGTPYIEK